MMMSPVVGFDSSPMRPRLSRKMFRYFIMNISEDLLYEDRLKIGELLL